MGAGILGGLGRIDFSFGTGPFMISFEANVSRMSSCESEEFVWNAEPNDLI